MDKTYDIVIWLALIPPISILCLPWRVSWRITFIICSAFLLGLALLPEPQDKGLGYTIGTMIISIYFISITIMCAARHLIFLFITNKKKQKNIIKSKKMKIFDMIISSYTGILISLFLIFTIFKMLSGNENGYIIHGTLIIITLILSIFFYKKYFLSGKTATNNKTFFIVSLIMPIFITSIIGIYLPKIVITQAERTASGNKYCILINSNQKTNFENLLLFTMPKNTIDYHAYLFVESNNEIKQYHWSYRNLKFMPQIEGWNRKNNIHAACKPEKNFKEDFLYSNKPQEIAYGYFNGTFIKIPYLYQPSMRQNYLSIQTKAPMFTPENKNKEPHYASVHFENRKWFDDFFEEGSQKYSMKNTETFSGNWNDFSKTEKNFNNYHIYDEQHQPLAAINCYPLGRPKDTACQHRFYRNHAMYSFEHSIELLPEAIEMENRFQNLIDSFGFKDAQKH